MALTQVPNAMLSSDLQGVTPGFKNRFINSAMMIDQRNAGGSYTVPAGGGYTIDRWHAEASQASKYTVQQNSGNAPTTQGFTQCLKVTSSSAYSLAAGDYFQIQQHIEGFNTADLNFGTASAKTVTLSFWVNASITGTYGLFIINGSSNRLYPTSYTVNSANTWEQKTITFTGDLSGTWGTTNGTGIRVAWVLGYGSTYTGATPNAWIAGGGLYVPSGCVNLLGTNGATLYITGAQFEKGSVATAFDYRSIGQETTLCQRYYCELGRQIFGRAESGTITTMVGAFPVKMRSSSVTVTVITSANAIGVPGLTSSDVSSVLTNNCNDNGVSLGIQTSGSAMLTGAPTVGNQNRIFGFATEL